MDDIARVNALFPSRTRTRLGTFIGVQYLA
jgi:hypothetical protein